MSFCIPLTRQCSQVIPVWLSWLPVWEDTDEAPHVYGYLCDLIDNNHPLVLGPNNSNLPRLMVIFSEVSSEVLHCLLWDENSMRSKKISLGETDGVRNSIKIA